MPRRRRQEKEGQIHHATMRGVDGELVFTEDEDRIGYLAMLAATVSRCGWHCLSYCLMGTHLHLLVETPQPNFGDGMRWLHGHYGRCFNRQHARDGHLFQGRYHDEPVLTQAHLTRAVGYIAVNPMDAGLCRDPRDWPWGSHATVTRELTRPWLAHDRLLGLLDGSGDQRTYDDIVATRILGG